MQHKLKTLNIFQELLRKSMLKSPFIVKISFLLHTELNTSASLFKNILISFHTPQKAASHKIRSLENLQNIGWD